MSKYTSLCGYIKTEQIAAKRLLLRVNFDGSNGIGGDIAEVFEELVALYMRGGVVESILACTRLQCVLVCERELRK